MGENKLFQVLKVLAKKRMEMSVLDIREYDSEYKILLAKISELRNKCDLLDLDQENKQVIEELLGALDDFEECQSYISYLAGIKDSIIILKQLDLIKD